MFLETLFVEPFKDTFEIWLMFLHRRLLQVHDAGVALKWDQNTVESRWVIKRSTRTDAIRTAHLVRWRCACFSIVHSHNENLQWPLFHTHLSYTHNRTQREEVSNSLMHQYPVYLPLISPLLSLSSSLPLSRISLFFLSCFWVSHSFRLPPIVDAVARQLPRKHSALLMENCSLRPTKQHPNCLSRAH